MLQSKFCVIDASTVILVFLHQQHPCVKSMCESIFLFNADFCFIQVKRILISTSVLHVWSDGSSIKRKQPSVRNWWRQLRVSAVSPNDWFFVNSCNLNIRFECYGLTYPLKCFTENRNHKMPVKTDIFGGHPAYISGLSLLDLENPDSNQQMYSKWAGSVKEFPKVIKKKVWQN